MTLEERALLFAYGAHAGQVRKYTGEPYVCHPISVAALVKTAKNANEEMIAAALLHDVVEDTNTTIDDIKKEFGGIVAIFVGGLTDISKPEDGNRATRKAIDREHLRGSLPPIQTIKLADLIDNSKSILERDADFARVYLKEKKALLEILIDGDSGLMEIAQSIVKEGI